MVDQGTFCSDDETHPFVECLCSGQMPAFNVVRLVCGSAETCLSVRFIFGVVAVEPDYLTD
jgi:hypothetical protein